MSAECRFVGGRNPAGEDWVCLWGASGWQPLRLSPHGAQPTWADWRTCWRTRTNLCLALLRIAEVPCATCHAVVGIMGPLLLHYPSAWALSPANLRRWAEDTAATIRVEAPAVEPPPEGASDAI